MNVASVRTPLFFCFTATADFRVRSATIGPLNFAHNHPDSEVIEGEVVHMHGYMISMVMTFLHATYLPKKLGQP